MRPGTQNAVALLLLMAFALVGTAASARDVPYKPAQLSDGRPDMEGMWDLKNATPLERLPQFKSLVITAAQADARNKERVIQLTEPGHLDFLDDGFDTLKIEPILGVLHSSVIVEPDNGLLPGNALFYKRRTEQRAAALSGFDGPEQRPNSERCLQHVRNSPPIMMGMQISQHQIVQSPGVVIFYTEMMHEARIIRLNAKHVPPSVVSWLGDSIGWWEGDTLVVETTRFTQQSEAHALGANVIFVSEQATLVERFTRASDEELHYDFSVDDPKYYTQRWRGENSFRRSTERSFESACHEGNYSLTNALQGARIQEQRTNKK